MSFERFPSYQAGVSQRKDKGEIFKLSSNENPFGPSPLVKDALKQSYLSLHLYPDSCATALREALAKQHHIKNPAQIVCGNGSDELLSYLAMITLEKGEEGLLFKHSFSIYERAILMSRGKVVKVAREKNHSPCLSRLLSKITEKSRILFLSIPDNPTGYAPDRNALKQWLEQIPPHVLCVIDGAYMEYLPADGAEKMTQLLSQLIEERDNIVMIRTFSKAYGLASLRVGWCYGSSKVMTLLDKVRPPFNLSTPAQKAAQATLKDHDWLQKIVWHNATWRSWLEGFFTKNALWFIPSSANFLLFSTSSLCDDALWAKSLFQDLLQNGIAVRSLAHYGFTGGLRVTVGSEQGCRRFARVVTTFLEKKESSSQ